MCEAARNITDMSGAGVMLMSADIPAGSLCTTNEVSRQIEELQYTLGEGPCVDAHRQDRVVVEPDLVHPDTRRWFAFTPQAVEAGVRALFVFPLQVGAVRLGALDLYREQAGPLSEDQHADTLVVADLIARWVLDAQADAVTG